MDLTILNWLFHIVSRSIYLVSCFECFLDFTDIFFVLNNCPFICFCSGVVIAEGVLGSDSVLKTQGTFNFYNLCPSPKNAQHACYILSFCLLNFPLLLLWMLQHIECFAKGLWSKLFTVWKWNKKLGLIIVCMTNIRLASSRIN